MLKKNVNNIPAQCTLIVIRVNLAPIKKYCLSTSCDRDPLESRQQYICSGILECLK